MASAIAAISGAASSSNRPPTSLSNRHFITKPQPAAHESPLAGQEEHQTVDAQAKADERNQAAGVIAGEPHPGIKAAEAREEGNCRRGQKQQRPGDENPHAFAARAAERLDVINV